MRHLAISALRAVIVALFLAGLIVQTVFVALIWADTANLRPEIAYVRIPLLAILIVGVLSAQVVLVCVWKLATMVRRGTVISTAAFRFVDVIMGAFVAAAVLVLCLAVLMASMNHRVPEDAVAPGLVLLVCGVSVAIFGVALVVLVLRMVLAQAVARDVEAAQLKAELDEVI